MDLLEYIKRNYETPNPYIIKDLGGSEELIEYLRNTPWNTNLNVIGSLGGGVDEPEVWLVGDTYSDEISYRIFSLNNVDATDHIAELYTNGNNYVVYLNSIELPYLIKIDRNNIAFTDNIDITLATIAVILADGIAAQANFLDISTAPTSVEVSVKAK